MFQLTKCETSNKIKNKFTPLLPVIEITFLVVEDNYLIPEAFSSQIIYTHSSGSALTDLQSCNITHRLSALVGKVRIRYWISDI